MYIHSYYECARDPISQWLGVGAHERKQFSFENTTTQYTYVVLYYTVDTTHTVAVRAAFCMCLVVLHGAVVAAIPATYSRG